MKKKLRIIVWNKYQNKCAYCGNNLEYNKMQIDHIIPKHTGGKDEIDNFNPSCRSCNFYKGTHSIEGFRKRMVTITERLNKIFIIRLAIKYGIIKVTPFGGVFYYEKN